MFKFSQRSKDRMVGVDADLIRVAERAIQLTKIDFGIPEYGGKRDAETQLKLFQKGVSKADGIEHLSKHQSGNALDFYAIDPDTGKASWDEGLLAQVASAFLQAAIQLDVIIEWGGLWKNFEDFPHIQLVEL